MASETILTLKAKEFKKMVDPNHPNEGHAKYVCYVQANSIPEEFTNWMSTNPREQKMSTNVARKISQSLEDNEDFHELNRGILISAETVSWDNKTNNMKITFTDSTKHGNIDGGHTLRAILNAKKDNPAGVSSDRYVFFEIIVGLNSPIELAAARNTSVQVDLKSIEELKNSFDVLKTALKKTPFSHRIEYKMNELYNDANIESIDIREIIAILLMFSQEIYPLKNEDGTLREQQPIQSYSGKEASLRKFLKCNASNPADEKKNREQMIKNMRKIIPDIFELFEKIETTFPEKAKAQNRHYGTRKYSKYNDRGEVVGKSFVKQTDLLYVIPKGIMYPLLGAFRALIQINEKDEYKWKKDPLTVWDSIGPKLVGIILDEKTENPDVLAKNSNLWSNLLKEVYIDAYL